MVIREWRRGRCEYWTSNRSMCGKRGRWMVDGQIMCGEHKRKLEHQHENVRIANFMKRVFNLPTK